MNYIALISYERDKQAKIYTPDLFLPAQCAHLKDDIKEKGETYNIVCPEWKRITG